MFSFVFSAINNILFCLLLRQRENKRKTHGGLAYTDSLPLWLQQTGPSQSKAKTQAEVRKLESSPAAWLGACEREAGIQREFNTVLEYKWASEVASFMQTLTAHFF